MKIKNLLLTDNFSAKNVNVLLSVKSRYAYSINTKGILTTLYVGTYDTALGKFTAMNYLNQLENNPLENVKV